MITLSLESIGTISFQARASEVNNPEWGQHCSNCRMPCLVSIFGTFWKSGHQPNNNPGVLFRCTADIFSNISDPDIQWPGMLIARKISQVGPVGCTNDWHNSRSSRKMILCIPPQIACVHLAVYSATFRVWKAHRLKIELDVK